MFCAELNHALPASLEPPLVNCRTPLLNAALPLRLKEFCAEPKPPPKLIVDGPPVWDCRLYVSDATALGAYPEALAMALIVSLAVTLMDPPYLVEDVVGVLPFVV